MDSAQVGISDSDYARRTRELLKLITQLRGLGAQADVDLPRIAVIGNQSAGKSSLVEAISGITVPRSSGTCTRCPMECRLTQSSPGAPWQCQVSLRIEFSDDTGKRLSQVKEKKFGPLITDPSLLEDVLRRAQLSILNPSVESDLFVDYKLYKASGSSSNQPPLGSLRQLQFSKNVVCLDLSGPDLTDLSFIDLPGIISNVGPGEDRRNIDLVRDLVIEHIQGNCLILLALTMRDDIENQSAGFLAKQADPKGRRTIGVLTKPDTLQAGEEGIWLEVLEGRRHPLLHGYYMTKQPAAKELQEKLPFAVARKREQEYFGETPVWANSSAVGRLGTPSLTKNLSKLLSGLIDQTLPKLRFDASKAKEATRSQLGKLPPAVSDNPAAELLRMVTVFSTDFLNFANGVSEYATLIQRCKPTYRDFKSAIRSTAPDFRPYTLKEKKKYPELVFKISDPEDASDDEGGDDPREQEADDVDEDSDEDSDEETSELQLTPSKPMYVDEVKKYIHGSLTRELPFNVPFSAKEGLIRQSMQTWEDHGISCFKEVKQVVAETLDTLVERHFGRFISSALLETVSSIVQRLVERHEEDTIACIQWLIKLEHRPFTQNNHYLTSYREKFLSSYRGVRRQKLKLQAQPRAAPQASESSYHVPRAMSPAYGYASAALGAAVGSRNPMSRSNSISGPPENMAQQKPQVNLEGILAHLVAAGYPVSSTQDLERLFASDPYEQVLIVMAEVGAYWRVAYKRIIDILPRAVDQDFVCALAEAMQITLVEGLSLGSADATARAAEYLAEDPDVVAERDRLSSKAARLDDVWDKLSRFKA